MTRAGEEGKYRQWNDARVETKRGRQASHLRVADIERDDQRRQRDAGGDLPREIGDFDPA